MIMLKVGKMIAPWLILVILSSTALAQDLSGAWRLVQQDGKPFSDESIKIYSKGYFMFAVHTADGKFINAGGGTYTAGGGSYAEVPDFYTSDSTKVRTTLSYTLSLKKDELTVTPKQGGNASKQVWKKVDDASAGMSGLWRFGARVNDEGMAGERRDAGSPRQTMKILSGKHFQWAAFNYETKQLSGTGGGTYQLTDGKYTETIRFFSRDNARVGMSLTFDRTVKGTDWYHKGKGTTGSPVSEVWEKVR